MPNVLYAVRPLPSEPGLTIFLAGPTPRDPSTPSWRPDAVGLLTAAGFTGTVIVPETEDGRWRQSYDDQVAWECHMRSLADVIAFWVPRDMSGMPALTTNIEFGEDLASGRMLYGRPPKAPKNKYLDHRWTERSGLPPFDDLADLMAAASTAAAAHAHLPPRTDGRGLVPAQAWASDRLRTFIERRSRDAMLVGFRIEYAISAGTAHIDRGMPAPVSDPSVPFESFTARLRFRRDTSPVTYGDHLVHVDRGNLVEGLPHRT